LAYAAAELERGRRVWATPDVLPVEAWLTREIERYAAKTAGVPRLLSPAEDWFLWRQCTAEATREVELVNRGALAEALRRASALAADFAISIPEVERSALTGGGELADAPGWPGVETALLAEVHRAVEERCRSLGAATGSSLVGRLGELVDQPRAVAAGFPTLPPRLRPLVAEQPAGSGSYPASQRKSGAHAHALTVPDVVIAADELDELERIADWCKTRVSRDRDVRILVTLPGGAGTRERLAALIRQALSPRAWLYPPERRQLPASESHSHEQGAPPEPAGRLAPAKPSDTSVQSGGALTESVDGLVVIEGGAPLAGVPAVAHALATLSWLSGTGGDFEAVSGWLRSPYWRSPAAPARARLDLWLRERERMRFNLRDLVSALNAVPSALGPVARELASQVNKAGLVLGQGAASPREWSERFRAALEVFGWPGERARSSGEQQTVVRFHELLDEFGQLASVARSISRDNAIQWFSELATRTAFRPADEDPVITISAVLAPPVVRYDAIWIAGLHAEAFPQPVQPDPFLPLAAQLAAGVPAASAAGRLAEARALVASWRACADELVLSAPARAEDLELLPSSLLGEWLPAPTGRAPDEAGRSPSAQPMATQPASAQRRAAQGSAAPQDESIAGSRADSGSIWLPMRVHRDGLLETVEDALGVSWPKDRPLPSGTRSLDLQNQCPFRAYAELRLGSTPLDAPEPGIAADLRGQLLHAALQKLWERLRDSRGLAALSNAALNAIVHRCVEEAANDILRGSAASNRTRPTKSNDAQGDLFGNPHYSPALSRECRRAERLIGALCSLERERAPFRVESTELESLFHLSNAQLRIRIDRVDALESGGRAILDYKSGRRTPADWYGERPSHPQLLAYLAALGEDVVAMATVNVTAREVRFDGIASSSELLPKLKGVEAPSTDAWATRRQEWVSRVEQLAAAFVAGSATVDPKPGACDYCHVASVCRIADRVGAAGSDVPPDGAAAIAPYGPERTDE
jgi:RecB family exonuclease